jgi:hypothetical protein
MAQPPAGARLLHRWPGAVFVVVAIPVLVAGVAVLFERWLPLGDLAVMVFQVSQVGTRHTPLVGAYSAKGFAHPGPLLFWLGAIPYRLAGHDPRALLAFSAFVSATSVLLAGWISGRIGRRSLQIVTAIAVALLLSDFGADLLVNPWNPYTSLLPFLVLLFCAWAAARGSRRALFGCAVAAAWVVEAHVAYLALVVVLSGWLTAWLVFERLRARSTRTDPTPLARPLALAVAVFALLMAPAVFDQLFGAGNLGALWRTFVSAPRARIGLDPAAGIVSRYLAPTGPWAGARVPIDLTGSVVGTARRALVVVTVGLAALLLASWRRRRVDVAIPVSLALVLDLAATPIVSRIPPPAQEYLVKWLHPLGAFTWLVIVWAVVELVPWPALVRRAAPAIGVAGGVLAVVVAVSILPSAWSPNVPDAAEAATVTSVLDQLREHTTPTGGPMRVDTTGDTFGQATNGIIADLIRRRYPVRAVVTGVDPWNHGYELRKDEQTPRTMTIVVTTTPPEGGAPVPRCASDPTQHRVAVAGDRSAVDPTYRIEVFEGPAPCLDPVPVATTGA